MYQHADKHMVIAQKSLNSTCEKCCWYFCWLWFHKVFEEDSEKVKTLVVCPCICGSETPLMWWRSVTPRWPRARWASWLKLAGPPTCQDAGSGTTRMERPASASPDPPSPCPATETAPPTTAGWRRRAPIRAQVRREGRGFSTFTNTFRWLTMTLCAELDHINPAHTISAALCYATQLVTILSHILDVNLPKKLCNRWDRQHLLLPSQRRASAGNHSVAFFNVSEPPVCSSVSSVGRTWAGTASPEPWANWTPTSSTSASHRSDTNRRHLNTAPKHNTEHPDTTHVFTVCLLIYLFWYSHNLKSLRKTLNSDFKE